MTDILGPTQARVTLPTTEVLLVVLVLVRRDELLSEDQLVTGVAPGSEQLGVVPSAVQPSVVLGRVW